MMPHPASGIRPQTQIDQAARVKLEIRDTDDEFRIINYMQRHYHDTPFESIEFLFHLRAPIMVVRQIERHRTFSYNEESARYGKLEDKFYIPSALRVASKINKQSSMGTMEDSDSWKDLLVQHYSASYSLYTQAIEAGMGNEQARLFLPSSAMYVRLMMKGNLRNFIHFLNLRLHTDAQWETQWYAGAIARGIDKMVGSGYMTNVLDGECLYNLEKMSKFDYKE